MKILLIEDELLIQKSLKKLLEIKGMEVMAVSTGADAINYIKESQFDRVICDLMLKDISGFDVIEEYRGLYGSDLVSKNIIIMTAYSSEQVLEKAKSYGCKLLSKPFQSIEEAINIFIN